MLPACRALRKCGLQRTLDAGGQHVFVARWREAVEQIARIRQELEAR